MGSPLVGNRHPHTQGTWLPATQSLCLSFPLCRRKITEPWGGRDVASLRGGKWAGSFRCSYEKVSTASLWGGGSGVPRTTSSFSDSLRLSGLDHDLSQGKDTEHSQQRRIGRSVGEVSAASSVLSPWSHTGHANSPNTEL